jgi:hypothetical protein
MVEGGCHGGEGSVNEMTVTELLARTVLARDATYLSHCSTQEEEKGGRKAQSVQDTGYGPPCLIDMLWVIYLSCVVKPQSRWRGLACVTRQRSGLAMRTTWKS